MKTYFSRAQLTLYYAKTQEGKHNLKQTEIFMMGATASKWWDSQIPKHKIEELKQIKLDHGFTEEDWDDIMIKSGSFYFAPTEQQRKCNKAIREWTKGIITTNGSYYSQEVFSGNLLRQVKRGSIKRFKHGDGVYRYYLADYMVEAIETRIKSL